MFLRIIALCFFGFAVSANASVLLEDNFEGSLGNWSTKGNAYLYTHAGKGMNYADGDSTGAVAIESGWGQGVITMNKSLLLDSIQASSVTISLHHEWADASITKYVSIDYSNDGGRTWSDDIESTSGWGTFAGDLLFGDYSKTLEEKTVGSFSDDFKFRIRGKAGGSGLFAYVDNIKISGTNVIAGPTIKDDIPEPSTLVFIMLLTSVVALRRRSRV